MADNAVAILHENNILSNEFPFRLIVNENRMFTWPLHWHQAMEILYIKKDSFEVLINDKVTSLQERDIVCIPGGRLHGFKSLSTTGTRVFVNFDLSGLDGYVGINRLTSVFQEVLFIRRQESPVFHREVEREILRLCEGNLRTDASRQFILLARMLDFLSVVFQGFNEQKELLLKESNSSVNNLESLDRAFTYIEENYMEKIQLEDIARAVGFSKCYFSRVFKKLTGKNFQDYLLGIRLRKAESLLMDRTLSVTDITYAIGFNSITTFERNFKQLNGCTPIEYRKMNNRTS